MVMFSFCLWGLVVLLFSSPCQDWIFDFFLGLKFSNCFPVKSQVFWRFFIFCTDGALNLPLRVVALPSSVTMSWPAETTWKLNRSGLDFLVPVLQNSNSLHMKAFFIFASVYFFLLTCFLFSFCPCGLVVPFFCSSCEDWVFWFFFDFKFSNCFPVKTHVFGRSFIFCTDGALKLPLRVVALPSSVTMSWSAETT